MSLRPSRIRGIANDSRCDYAWRKVREPESRRAPTSARMAPTSTSERPADLEVTSRLHSITRYAYSNGRTNGYSSAIINLVPPRFESTGRDRRSMCAPLRFTSYAQWPPLASRVAALPFVSRVIGGELRAADWGTLARADVSKFAPLVSTFTALPVALADNFAESRASPDASGRCVTKKMHTKVTNEHLPPLFDRDRHCPRINNVYFFTGFATRWLTWSFRDRDSSKRSRHSRWSMSRRSRFVFSVSE